MLIHIELFGIPVIHIETSDINRLHAEQVDWADILDA